MTTANELRALVTQALDADPAASNRTLTLSVLAQLGQVPHDQRQYERVKQALVRQRRRNENPRPWGGARPNSGPPLGNTNARQIQPTTPGQPQPPGDASPPQEGSEAQS